MCERGSQFPQGIFNFLYISALGIRKASFKASLVRSCASRSALRIEKKF